MGIFSAITSFIKPVVSFASNFLDTSLGGAVSSAAQGYAAYKGIEATNQANEDRARESMAFSANQAQKQMDFQERMSSTTYQRGMADMKTAGLNPILAYKQGGASSPSGASGTGAAIPAIDQMGPALSTSFQAQRLRADLASIKQTTSLTKTQVHATNQSQAESFAREQYINEQARNERVKTLNSAYETMMKKAQLKRLGYDTDVAELGSYWAKSKWGRGMDVIQRSIRGFWTPPKTSK